MWESFFLNAIVYGVDIEEKCKMYEGRRRRILVKDLSNVDEILQLSELKPKIVVDDASHLWSHQILALCGLLHSLQSGGIYILEDLATSFRRYKCSGYYDDAVIDAFSFVDAIAKSLTGDEHIDKYVDNRFFEFADEIEEVADMIETITFMKGSCILIKK